MLGKVIHYVLVLVVPWVLHGPWATLAGAAGYSTTLSIILAMVFFVSHNVPQSKPLPAGKDTREVLFKAMLDRDWGEQQVRGGLFDVGLVRMDGSKQGFARSCSMLKRNGLL